MMLDFIDIYIYISSDPHVLSLSVFGAHRELGGEASQLLQKYEIFHKAFQAPAFLYAFCSTAVITQRFLKV